ncbi:Rho guanine nucleotide exchange factor [Marasmius tenuissimus]|uniref:Rho guanine nucleotide exchange factor n=1 Tax=Marasmius tenuissimus TaxID=585030 RepID=A0ABR2ZSM4_9AGAR
MDSLEVTDSLKDVQHAAQDVPMDDDLEMTDSFEDSLKDAQRVVQDVLNDEDKYRKIIEAKGDDAQECLDLLQLLAEQSKTSLQSSMLKMMLRLLEHSGLYPQCLVVKDVKRPSGRPAGGGSFGDVYKGVIGGQAVCLKLPRIFEDTEDPDADKLIKVLLHTPVTRLDPKKCLQLGQEYMREAIVWRQLNHPNLLPFIGVYYLDEAPNQLCLISPWMERGDLTRYLKSAQKQNADVDRLLLAYDVAAGLSYLHSKKIVHGDLKGPNVLMNADERALIGDFGLSRVVETHTPGLFNSTTERSDIYAYAGVCYEIFTGKQPFYKLHDMAIFDAVVNREERPDRPEEARELSDSIWEIMMSCWQYDQHLRPSVGDVFARIGELKNPKTGTAVQTRSAPDLSLSSHGQIWLDVKCPPINTAVLHRLLSQQKNTPSVHGPHNTEVVYNSLPSSHSRFGTMERIYAILQDGEKCRKVLGAREGEAQRYLDLFYAVRTMSIACVASLEQ